MPVPTQINGLPAHVLLIHVVIAAVPLAALMLVASATWPAARARLGVLTPLVALVARGARADHHERRALARATTSASPTRGCSGTRALGGELLPWTIGVFLLAAAGWALSRRFDLAWRPAVRDTEPADESAAGRGGTATLTRTAARKQALPVWINAAVALVSVAVAVGTVIQLYRIGDSGAQAVWHGVGAGGR